MTFSSAPRRGKGRWIVLAVVTCVVLGGSAFYLNRRHAREDRQTLLEVTRKSIAHTLQLAGKIVPVTSMTIIPRQSGRIVDIAVLAGAKVKEGDLLFTMRLEAEGQTELLQKRSEVQSLRQQVQAATRSLAEKRPVRELIGSASVIKEENDLEKLKLDLRASEERLAVLESDLGLGASRPKGEKKQPSGIVNVTSPRDGVVTLIDKRPGDLIFAGASTGDTSADDRMVMVVADMSTLTVRTRVLEADLRYVKLDIPVKVRLDAYPDANYDGSVQHIGGQGRTDSKAGYTYFDVDIAVTQKDARVLPEMNATVDLIFAKKDNALTLPVAGVVIFPDRAIVRLPDDSAPEGYVEKEVEVGVVNEDDVEIVSGLAEGDKVLEIDFASLDPSNSGKDKKSGKGRGNGPRVKAGRS